MSGSRYGHKIRWFRPTNIYNFIRRYLAVALICALASGPAFAAETSARHKAQAAPELSPAMALALALGVRNVAGPMHHSNKTTVSSPPSGSRQASLLPSDTDARPSHQYSLQSRIAMEGKTTSD